MTELTRENARESIERFLPSIPAYPGGYEGRGIVICGGGEVYFTNAMVLVKLLRHHACQLPIELWHLGPSEFDERMEEIATGLGVRCVNAEEVQKEHPAENLAGWPLKPYSVLYSRFREVMLIDADNFPTGDPAYLFDSAEYAATGAVFWPDVGVMGEDDQIWDIMGLPFRREFEFESGQLMVDKERCWEGLQLTMWMNENNKFFYDHMYGDKDTFRFAFHKVGKEFSMPATPVEVITLPEAGPHGVLCQHDFEGERIFQHRSMFKWKLNGYNPRIPGFIHEHLCLRLLRELAGVWDGRVGWQPEEPSADERAFMEQLTAQRLLFREGDKDDRIVHEIVPSVIDPNGGIPVSRATLAKKKTLPSHREVRVGMDGRIQLGANAKMNFWEVSKAGGNWILKFSNGNGPTAHLRQLPDGRWKGQWLTKSAVLISDTIGKESGDRPPEDSDPESPAVVAPDPDPTKGWEDDPKSNLWIDELQSYYPVSRPQTVPAKEEVAYELREKYGERIALSCSATGIGDAATAIYAAAAAASAGLETTFYTNQSMWFDRVSHPGLKISGDAPPEDAIDLNRHYGAQLRYAGDKAYWFSGNLSRSLIPRRPETINRRVETPALDFDRYVILAPFSAWEIRNWPGSHWARLAILLDRAGYEVIAVGVKGDGRRMAKIFSNTFAYTIVDADPAWVVDALLGCSALVSNDSGLAHVGGLLDIPTLSIHAHLPPEFLWSCSDVTSVYPQTDCAGCRWQNDGAYNEGCDVGCSAIATIGPDQVIEALRERIE